VENLQKLTITPELAREYLDRNSEDQRRVTYTNVNKYATDMKEGRWNEELIQPIRIDEEGNLIDGQHRLLAIIESGTPIEMWVQTNLPKQAFYSIDIGDPRAAKDFIGGEYRSGSAAISKVVAALLHGASLKNAMHGLLARKTQVPMSLILDTCEKENINAYAKYAYKLRENIKCGPHSAFGVALWLISYIYGEDEMHRFIEDFVSDVPFRTTSILKTYIMQHYLTKGNMTKDAMLEIILSMHAYYREQKIIKRRPSTSNFSFQYETMFREKFDELNPTCGVEDE
jgi:hypothetical protein